MSAEWAFRNLPAEGAVATITSMVEQGHFDLLIGALQAMHGDKMNKLHIALDETYRFIMDSGRRTAEEAERIGKRDILWALETRHPELAKLVPTHSTAKSKMWRDAGLSHLPRGRGNEIRNL